MASITLLHFISVVGSLVTIFVAIYILNALLGVNPNLYHVMDFEFKSPTVWLTLILSTSIPLLMELAFRAMKREIQPAFSVILQEKLRLKRKDLRGTGGASPLPKGDSMPLQQSGPVSTAGTGEKSPKGPASAQVVTSHQEEEKWASVKKQNPKTAMRSADALKSLEKNRLSIKDRNEGKVREAVIRSMLRFRNLTGGQFDSAAQAKFQNHDEMVKPRAGGARDEGKVPDGPLDV